MPDNGSLRALLVYPKIDGMNGVYNDLAVANKLVKVDLNNLANVPDEATFYLWLHRGYGARKFWGETVVNGQAGVDKSSEVTNAKGYDGAFHTNMSFAGDNNASGKWKSKDALVEVSTHASKGLLGWYVGTFEGATPTKEQELFHPLHDYEIDANAATGGQVYNIRTECGGDYGLDDVFLFVAGGCNTWGDPDGEGAEKSLPATLKDDLGVDVVMSWDKEHTENRHLFVKHFLNISLTAVGDVYPTMSAAADAAKNAMENDGVSQADANYVRSNLKWGGTLEDPETKKLYPPRYGKRDKQ